MPKVWTEKRKLKAQKLREAGKSWSAVGEALGVSAESARCALREPVSQVADKGSEKIIKSLQQSLAAARGRQKVKLSRRTLSTGGDFVRVIIPDVHGCFMDRAAVSACLADVQRLAPAEVVILGDLIDCGGFLAQHHTWGYVAESDYSFEDDVCHANSFLDELQEAAPKAVFHFLEGNHERRIETWCLTQAMRSKKDASFLLNHLAVEEQMHLKQRGFHYYKQGRFYGDCRKPNTIKLGKCYFTHGEACGANAARATLAEFGYNVVFGHTHTTAESSKRSVEHGEVRAWNPGSLCRLQPLWNHGRLSNWNHGYGVQFVSKKSGNFQHINVAIHEGESMISPLTSRMCK